MKDANQKNNKNSDFIKQKITPIAAAVCLLILVDLLFVNWLRNKNVSVNNSEGQAGNIATHNLQSDSEELATIKDRFMKMKKEIMDFNQGSDINSIAAEYFMDEYAEQIKDALAKATNSNEQIKLFRERVLFATSFYNNITNINITINNNIATINISTTDGEWEANLKKINDKWLYNGEEKRLTLIDDNGEELKVVTEETAEYQITTNEYGEEVKVMNEGQVIFTNQVIMLDEASIEATMK